MQIRTAQPSDAAAMSAMLGLLVAAGKRKSAADAGFVLAHYIQSPDGIRCSLAEDADGALLGFQSLIHSRPGNRYGTPVGWGIIGTHVSPLAARRGVGSALFQVTRQAAKEAGLREIEAFIGETNQEALAYYEKMGFRTYRLAEGIICKSYKVE